MSKEKQRKNKDYLTRQAQQIDQHLQLIRQRLRQPLESAFSKGNVTAAQRTIMHALVSSFTPSTSAQGLSLKQLSQQVGLAHSTVSGIVDRLEARGMVQRTVDPDDRRATLVSPTREVRNFLRDKMPTLITSPIVEVLERATPSQRKTIRRGLQELRNLLEKKVEKNG
jgi:DNA-binding MarR family transcriptional regulator